MTENEKKLIDSIDPEEVIELTRDLVRIDSVIRPETGNTESKVVAFIADWIRREIGVEPVIEEVQPERQNIILTLRLGNPEANGKGKTLMLEGHTDVVSEGDRSLWKHDPFAADLVDGKIYGRGSCDMKAGVALNLVVAKHLSQVAAEPSEWGLELNGKLRLGIVCDEEGMMTGIRDFIKQGHADDVDACLVSEPEENQLCISMKGALRAIVRVYGKMAHGAMPLTGINPNIRLAKIILAFAEYEEEEKQRCGEDQYLGWPSITPTVVQAPPEGEPAQLNVMPGSAQAYIDIRTTPCQDHETIKQRLQRILDQLGSDDPGFKAEIEFIDDKPVVTMEKNEPIVQESARAYLEISGKEPRYNGVPGATDGTFLRALKGIPSLVNGPGPRHMPHQRDEYVETTELIEAAKIYLLTAERYLSNQASGK